MVTTHAFARRWRYDILRRWIAREWPAMRTLPDYFGGRLPMALLGAACAGIVVIAVAAVWRDGGAGDAAAASAPERSAAAAGASHAQSESTMVASVPFEPTLLQLVKPPASPPAERLAPPVVAASPDRVAGATRAPRTPAGPRQAPAASITASAAASRAPANTFRGSLAVDSTPPGARVTLNGTLLGTTPLQVRDLPVGSRVIRVELPDHNAWTSSIRVVANAVTRVRADLHRSAP
jgi:hypothetical protein